MTDISRPIFIVTIYLGLVANGLAENFKIYMVSAGTCGDVVFHVDPLTSYTILWQGDNPGPQGCRYHFSAKFLADSVRQVCVEARDFFVEKSGIYLSYFEVPNSTLSKVYMKGRRPQTFCTSNAKDLELEVKTIFSSPSRLQSHFSLHVYGKYVANSGPDKAGIKIGFTVAGSIILLTAIAIVIKVKLYRGNSPPKYPIPSFSTSYTSSVPTSSAPSSSVTVPASSVTVPSSSVTVPSSSVTEPSSSVTEPSSSVTVPSSSVIEPSSSDKNSNSSFDQPELVLAVYSLDPRDSERSRTYQTVDAVFNKDTEQLIV